MNMGIDYPKAVCPICGKKGGVSTSRLCGARFLCFECGKTGGWALFKTGKPTE